MQHEGPLGQERGSDDPDHWAESGLQGIDPLRGTGSDKTDRRRRSEEQPQKALEEKKKR